MNRKSFLKSLGVLTAATIATPTLLKSEEKPPEQKESYLKWDGKTLEIRGYVEPEFTTGDVFYSTDKNELRKIGSAYKE